MRRGCNAAAPPEDSNPHAASSDPARWLVLTPMFQAFPPCPSSCPVSTASCVPVPSPGPLICRPVGPVIDQYSSPSPALLLLFSHTLRPSDTAFTPWHTPLN